LQILV